MQTEHQREKGVKESEKEKKGNDTQSNLYLDKRCLPYLCVEDGHNSVFGFPHIVPLPAHLDVWICRE